MLLIMDILKRLKLSSIMPKKFPVFEDYLDKETTLYRGADPNERYKPGSFAEFTPYYDTAARFAIVS